MITLKTLMLRIGLPAMLAAMYSTLAMADVVRRPEAAPQIVLPQEAELYHQDPPQMSPEAQPVPVMADGFGRDPVYEESAYDPEAQYAIYGNKRPVPKVHPLIELGQPLYGEGPLNKTYNIIGSKNLVSPQFYVYGDWRTVVAYNNNAGSRLSQIATRLNLDVDLKLTATERVHALFRPVERNGRFTRNEFAGTRNQGFQLETDLRPVTLFFEGDLGAITSGLKDEYVKWDLPFTFGFIPLVFQNGVWVDDAFIGAAVAIPSKNSRTLDISNMDFTFFVGTNQVSTAAIKNAAGRLDLSGSRIYGATTFIESREGYLEAGYGYTDDTRNENDFSYHNATLAFTKRYGGFLSNSLRIIANWGQDPERGARKTADGYVLIAENSLITHLPSTLVPYANFFFGQGKPQSLARDAGAGGVLKNVGLSFETDGLTGFPKLDDSANDTYGGAIGVEYLFGLDRQVVVELASVQIRGSENDVNRVAKGDQYAIGARYQVPLNNAWIFRADAMASALENAPDQVGLRLELRRKF